jgi:hypothetical protein
MPLVGLEPTIPVIEQAKTVHALDRAATVIGSINISICYLNSLYTAHLLWEVDISKYFPPRIIKNMTLHVRPYKNAFS